MQQFYIMECLFFVARRAPHWGGASGV